MKAIVVAFIGNPLGKVARLVVEAFHLGRFPPHLSVQSPSVKKWRVQN